MFQINTHPPPQKRFKHVLKIKLQLLGCNYVYTRAPLGHLLWERTKVTLLGNSKILAKRAGRRLGSGYRHQFSSLAKPREKGL